MEGLFSLLLFAVFFYVMMRFGCGSHGHGGHKHSKTKDNDTKNIIDPVCGMSVEVDKGYGKPHEGNLYRFCSRNCLDKFDQEPERYLNQQLDHTHGGA